MAKKGNKQKRRAESKSAAPHAENGATTRTLAPAEANRTPVPDGRAGASYLRFSVRRLSELCEAERATMRQLERSTDNYAAAALVALGVAHMIGAPLDTRAASFAFQLLLGALATVTGVCWLRARVGGPAAPNIPPAVFATDADHPERAAETEWLGRTRRSLLALAREAQAARLALEARVAACRLAAAATLAMLLFLPLWEILVLLVRDAAG